jgi:hypothetical protein
LIGGSWFVNRPTKLTPAPLPRRFRFATLVRCCDEPLVIGGAPLATVAPLCDIARTGLFLLAVPRPNHRRKVAMVTCNRRGDLQDPRRAQPIRRALDHLARARIHSHWRRRSWRESTNTSSRRRLPDNDHGPEAHSVIDPRRLTNLSLSRLARRRRTRRLASPRHRFGIEWWTSGVATNRRVDRAGRSTRPGARCQVPILIRVRRSYLGRETS